MRRGILSALLVLAMAAPAFADVTIVSKTSGKGMGMSMDGTTTVYIKGLKMRSDTRMKDRVATTIFDLDAQKMYSFDSKKKEVDVWDMQAFADQLNQNVQVSDMKATIEPNGQTKQIAGKSAQGYDMNVSMPTAMGGNKDMTMTVTLTGPVWIVKGAPGTQDYARFYRAAAEKGWIFTDPRAAKGSPGQAKSMTEMYRLMADLGGVAYGSDIEVKMGAGEGGGGGFGGMMGGLMKKMGGMSASSEVESVDTGALADDLFTPPAGYKLKPQK
ncbi:MAG: hypothetical protein AB7H88_10385 [Vicinamibacterales bacterium]